ncbi:hypothetical protein E2C01_010530 [Portunus trituberculatus]|uniref:Uncharacterized protein n=1 Tax=Portunus trituberculatus TaxID=210409 RepID=A0A5B7D8W9_PORTR|nr:hypothetical protein [Portunus trituberculatus]
MFVLALRLLTSWELMPDIFSDTFPDASPIFSDDVAAAAAAAAAAGGRQSGVADLQVIPVGWRIFRHLVRLMDYDTKHLHTFCNLPVGWLVRLPLYRVVRAFSLKAAHKCSSWVEEG